MTDAGTQLAQPQIKEPSILASQLLLTLGEMAEIYVQLLTNLQSERSYLVQANVEKLVENTGTKEKLLYRIRILDRERQNFALAFAKELGLPSEEMRLSELAKKVQSKGQNSLAESLRLMHKTLSQQIEKVIEVNQDNEVYAQSALKTLNGAMDEIKQTVTVKPTYGKKGRMAGNQETSSGNFVSREV